MTTIHINVIYMYIYIQYFPGIYREVWLVWWLIFIINLTVSRITKPESICNVKSKEDPSWHCPMGLSSRINTTEKNEKYQDSSIHALWLLMQRDTPGTMIFLHDGLYPLKPWVTTNSSLSCIWQVCILATTKLTDVAEALKNWRQGEDLEPVGTSWKKGRILRNTAEKEPCLWEEKDSPFY